MKQEWTELVEMCPAENRESYSYAKESELVKICLKHLKHTEYDNAIKELLNEIKFDRKLARAVGGDDGDEDDANEEDWEYRNYKDGWVPTFQKLRDKLVSCYKEAKYNNQSSSKDEDSPKRIPAMVTKALIQKAVAAMFAPGFGQRPQSLQRQGVVKDAVQKKMKCWACGLFGHKKGDSICKAVEGSIHENAPAKAKRKFNADNEKFSGGEPSVKKFDGICRFYSRNGNCKFGAACKFKHEGGSKPPKNKKVKFSQKDKKQVNALKTQINQGIKNTSQDEIDELVRGFLMARTIPRECICDGKQVINALNTCLVDMTTFAFDTGAGEGISTSKDDFVYLDTSDKSRNSCTIQGPSVGSPTCEGRGPLVYIFKLGERIMGLVHPNGILASSAEGSTEFRLASAMQLKKKGVRYLGGKFNSSDTIECVRSGTRVPALDIDGILTIKTDGVASELEDCMEFHKLVKDIDSGLTSPLIDVTPFIKTSSKLDNLRLSAYLNTSVKVNEKVKVYLFDE
jgi:hypothetical protein